MFYGLRVGGAGAGIAGSVGGCEVLQAQMCCVLCMCVMLSRAKCADPAFL
jgi:hypothetical protein